MSLANELYQLSSVRHFLEHIADDLAYRKSVLAVLPDGVPPVELCDFLRTEIAERALDFREVSFIDLKDQGDSVIALGNILEVCWEGDQVQRTVANLIAADALPEVVLFSDLDRLSPSEAEAWITFLTRWAEVCEIHSSHGNPPTALCFVGSASGLLDFLPESRSLLALHWWWGFPSALETRVLCRTQEWHPSENRLACWREFLLPSLVGSDSSLVVYLWDAIHRDDDYIIDRLRLCASDRGWDADSLRTWEATRNGIITGDPSSVASLTPPPEVRAPWARGILGWTQEFGLELHTAALAELGMVDEIQHRLWRGQVGLLLPKLDRCRIFLCQYLTSKYGSNWPTRWLRPRSASEDLRVSRNPLACQLGHLARVLDCGYLRNEEAHWLRYAQCALRMRNEIAHFRAVKFRDFEIFDSLDRSV